MFTQTFHNLDALSAEETKRLQLFRSRFGELRDQVRTARDSGTLPLLRLPHDEVDTRAIQDVATRIRSGAKGLVVLGTGGSGLGGQTVCELAEGDFPAWFIDNLDPHTI